MSRTWDYEIQLADVVKGINENGFEVETLVYKDEVLANKLSVHSREFWLAKQNVVELSHVFEIHEIEYSGERALRYENQDYNIERTFLNKDGYVELVTSYWGDEHGN